MSSAAKLYTNEGRLVVLDAQIGSGGEGAVFTIKGDPDNVAKIYHSQVSPEKVAKLSGMVQTANPRLTDISAWPIQTLSDNPSSGQLRGIVMPRVIKHKEIHHLYGPAHRKRDFPMADWSFLIHAARNIASAFDTIHTHGHVIGDVNQSGILISPQATCRLIDTDSFQVKLGKAIYYCDVGVPQFTPSELQGLSFHGIERTPNHDNFGLALLCFHLLFMGRHPFAGRYSGPKDMPIERAIKEFRYVFGKDAKSKLMAPPPNSLPMSSVSPAIMRLFDAAFSQEAALQKTRPTAREWVQNLEELQRRLKTCRQYSSHKFYEGLDNCPWCQLEQVNGIIFFIANIILPIGNTFVLQDIFVKIQSIQPPQKLTLLPMPSQVIPNPLPPELQGYEKWKKVKPWIVGIGVIAATTILFALNAGGAGIIVGLLLLFGSRRWGEEDSPERKKRSLALQTAEKMWNRGYDDWLKLDVAREFKVTLKKLEEQRDQYQDLNNMKQKERESDLLQYYLEQKFISDAKISGIGPARVSTLSAWGVETAADITPIRIQNVPGFGPKLTTDLLNWRNKLETGYKSSPHPSNPALLASIEQKYERIRQDLEQSLMSGPAKLEQIALRSMQQQQAAQVNLQNLAQNLAQAKADMSIF